MHNMKQRFIAFAGLALIALMISGCGMRGKKKDPNKIRQGASTPEQWVDLAGTALGDWSWGGGYDESGNLIGPGGLFDKDGNFVGDAGGYDVDGVYIGGPGGYYDENGNLIGPGGGYDINGQPVMGLYDRNGNKVGPDGGFDQYGNPVGGHFDASGNYVGPPGMFDEDGNLVGPLGGYNSQGEYVGSGGGFDAEGNKVIPRGGYFNSEGKYHGPGGGFDQFGNYVGPGGMHDAEGNYVGTSTTSAGELTQRPDPETLTEIPGIVPVYFGYDQATIPFNQYPAMDAVVDFLNANPAQRVIIEGHCDERGSKSYNLALGERRAGAIRSFLVEKGIDPDRVNTSSYGSELPIDFGHSESSWSKNRRAEFKFSY